MRSAILFAILLTLATVPISNPAQGLDSSSGIVLTAVFDDTTESTTITIYVPVTNNATLLDELKETSFVLSRAPNGIISEWEPAVTGIQLCDQSMTNSECSGAVIQFDYYPESNLVPAAPSNPAVHYTLLIEQDLPTRSEVASSCCIDEEVSPILSVDNLTADYSSEITTLFWDYPENTPMNHSVMIYSHYDPATVENWDTLPKTIVSNSIAAGTTSYEINHSGSPVEREIYYSVTLLYETSEDTRFFTDNTLANPVWEDNVAPLFIGELSAIFDADTDTTTIDWGEGVQDDDLSINIYRSNVETNQIDTHTLIASIDSSLSSYQVQVPVGEHRQSWYAITLQDSEGNEILTLSESSPVSDVVIESTLDTTTVTDIEAERYGDGTIVITWEDDTNNPDAVARLWRSFTGPITSLQNVEELSSANVSNEQLAHNPLNAQDEAWYAVTIDGAWGTEQEIWHDERLFLGINSMSMPIRETEDPVEESVINFSTHVLTTSGIRATISDGTTISLGELDQNDLIVISTSYPVANISCYDISGDGTVIHSGEDWALSFSANQSGEECGGLISDGDGEITFYLSWNYVETQVTDDRDDSTDRQDNEDEDREEREDEDRKKDDGKEVAATAILSILILALVIYLVVMMRKQDYTEEE
tara:strand:- start:167 stop:2113 length:1947 start_codon:yes stop_codon:yes gene_type:complete